METQCVREKPSCDVVMKGGITSGVVYPRALTELAKAFRIRNVGGTSAGAIAAAAAAAATLGETKKATEPTPAPGAKKPESSGYELLDGLPNFLGGKNFTDRNNLFAFFQPQPATRKFFDTLISILGVSDPKTAFLKLFGSAVLNFPGWPLTGLCAGLALLGAEIIWGCWPLGILWFLICAILGIATMAWRFVVEFSAATAGSEGGNNFGLCTGMSTDPAFDLTEGRHKGGQALTVWLTKYLNDLAGLDPDGPPLTFGQLWHPDAPAGQAPSHGAEKEITLNMFTTCLSKGRPFQLPFRTDKYGANENVFYFIEEDLRKLFPKNVVEWMKANQRGPGKAHHRPLPDGFLRMPDPWNLPVVVATRMSLSFPILLSAVRLWAFKSDPRHPAPVPRDTRDEPMDEPASRRPATAEILAPCWFSDGGICSNFPIHLFDGPLPAWPTFGLNLVDVPADTPDAELKIPWMPETNNDGIHEPWTTLDEHGTVQSLAKFIWSIIGTMQNWNDATLSRMPGYRDRIAQVQLKPEEGGLNLNMPAPLITKLSDRGANAATEFTRRFTDRDVKLHAMNWSNHRWIRFRTLIAALEEMLANIEDTCLHPDGGDIPFDRWVSDLKVGEAPSYQWTSEEQRQLALKILDTLRALAEFQRKKQVSTVGKSPRPSPELRARPRI